MHLRFDPPQFVPQREKFHGVPDPDDGSITTEERTQAHAAIRNFGRQGKEQQQYVTAFFRGAKDGSSPPEATACQIGDIGKYFPDLSADALKAVNLATANVRFINADCMPGQDAKGETIPGVDAYSATVVSVAETGSEYAAICAGFQHNLNVGWKG